MTPISRLTWLTTPSNWARGAHRQAANSTSLESRVIRIGSPIDCVGGAQQRHRREHRVYSQTGAGDFVWFTSQASTPAVRLITGSFEAGCIDEAACNYDPSAGVSDGSCLFVGEPCDDGWSNTINDVVTENCQCEGEGVVYGCTDQVACNYESEANVDDGSCCNCDGENSSSGSLLYFEDFESYAVGSTSGLWTARWHLVHMDQRRRRHGGRCPDLQRNCPVGSQSLKLFGGLAGGPMDILLTIGLKALTK